MLFISCEEVKESINRSGVSQCKRGKWAVVTSARHTLGLPAVTKTITDGASASGQRSIALSPRSAAGIVARLPHALYTAQAAQGLAKLGARQVALNALLGHGVQHSDQRRAAEHHAGIPVRPQHEVLAVVVIILEVDVAAGPTGEMPAPHTGAAEARLVPQERLPEQVHHEQAAGQHCEHCQGHAHDPHRCFYSRGSNDVRCAVRRSRGAVVQPAAEHVDHVAAESEYAE